MHIYIYIYIYVSLQYGVLLRAPGPAKHQPSVRTIFRVLLWLLGLMVVRVCFKLFGKTI